jgi:hypothetical protein
MSLVAHRKTIDPEIPPTAREDWIGAAVGRLGEKRAEIVDPVTFHVFQSSAESVKFALSDREDAGLLPPCSDGGDWLYFKRFTETGQRRVGLSEAAAKADIGGRGYHLVSFEERVREKASAD